MRLKDKVVIITGGTSGIGKATALLFAREGAKVSLGSSRNTIGGNELVRVIKEQGGKALYVQTDVSKASDCSRLVGQTIEEFGQLDILFNNAGFSNYGSVITFAEADWDRLMAVNAKGTFLMSREAIPHMIEAGGGSIINNSSVHAIRTRWNAAAYAASKAAIIGLTQAMALELGKDRIRVNAIAPGSIDQFVYPNPADLVKGKTEDGRHKTAHLEPMRRMGRPDDVAFMVLYLASDESAYISGATLPIDGALLTALRLG